MLELIKHKNPFIRYQAIDNEIRRVGNTTFEQIKDAVENALYEIGGEKQSISIRQLRKDLEFMRRKKPEGLDAPIEIQIEGKKRYYYYSNNDFVLQGIKTSDLVKLNFIAKSFQRFQGIEQLNWLSELNNFIEENSHKNNIKPVISFDDNFDYVGSNLVAKIYEAILNKEVLEVEYKGFNSSESTKLILHPQFLKQYNYRWFLFAKNEMQENRFNFSQYALDRILNIQPIKGKYIDLQMNWEEDYFSNRIGVSSRDSETIEEVELCFDPNLKGYIETKPLHQTQKPVKLKDDGSFNVTIKVALNYELEQLILGFGEQVSVVRPLELREKIVARIERAVNKYNI